MFDEVLLIRSSPDGDVKFEGANSEATNLTFLPDYANLPFYAPIDSGTAYPTAFGI
jgi:hypothetical protein